MEIMKILVFILFCNQFPTNDTYGWRQEMFRFLSTQKYDSCIGYLSCSCNLCLVQEGCIIPALDFLSSSLMPFRIFFSCHTNRIRVEVVDGGIFYDISCPSRQRQHLVLKEFFAYALASSLPENRQYCCHAFLCA